MLTMNFLSPQWQPSRLQSANRAPPSPLEVSYIPQAFSSYRTRPKSEDAAKRSVRTIASVLVDAQKLGRRTDVTFSFPGSDVTLQAHRLILSLGSPVFDSMLYGPEGDSDSVGPIEIRDASPDEFSLLLEFLYTHTWPKDKTVKTSVAVIYIAKKYLVLDLIKCIENQLQDSITWKTVFPVMKAAVFFDFAGLESKCWECLEIDTHRALSTDSFLSLNFNLVRKILERDTLNIPEEKLWEALLRWTNAECDRQDLENTLENCKSIIGDAYKLIRFPLMGPTEFMSGPAASGILSPEEVINCMATKYGKSSTDPPLFSSTKRIFRKQLLKMDCRCRLTKIPCYFCKDKAEMPASPPQQGSECDEVNKNASADVSQGTPKTVVISTGIPTIFCMCRSRSYCPMRRVT